MSKQDILDILSLKSGFYTKYIKGYSAERITIVRMKDRGFKTIRRNGIVTYYNEQGDAILQTCEALDS